MKLRKLPLLLLLLWLALSPDLALAGGLGKAAARAAARRLTKTGASTLARDLRNHRLALPKPLAKPRVVHRYTSWRQALQERSHGISPNRHFTAVARRGRSLRPEKAAHRFGLPRLPQVRETVQLPKGLSVRHTRVVSGKRGVRELTSPHPLAGKAVRKITPLR